MRFHARGSGRTVLLIVASLALVLTGGCRGDKTEQDLVAEFIADPLGGIYTPVEGFEAEVLAGTFAQPQRIQIFRQNSLGEHDLAASSTTCGAVWRVAPRKFAFADSTGSVTIRVKRSCPADENAYALVTVQPNVLNWTALENTDPTRSDVWTTVIREGGQFAEIPLVVNPSSDTTVMVGSAFQPTLQDVDGQIVSGGWVWTRSDNVEVLSPDSRYAGGRQRANKPGVARLTVEVPNAGWGRTLTIQVEPNRVRDLTVLQGDGQEALVGEAVPDSLIVLVRDGAGEPVAGAWVDFYQKTKDGSIVQAGNVASDERGRATTVWYLNGEPGAKELFVRVPGTELVRSIKAKALAAR